MKKLLIALFLCATLQPHSHAQEPDTTTGLFGRVQRAMQNFASNRNFYYFTQADRVAMLRDLIEQIDAEYALLSIKARRTGMNFSQISSEAIAAETQIADVTDQLAQAESNIAFIDRMKRFVALFQDTHFGIQTRAGGTVVSVGLQVAEVNGKVVVASLAHRLLGYNNARGDAAASPIAIGDEITAIDGVPVSQVIGELEPYISASSPAYRHNEAVHALTLRDFKYPSNGMTEITFKKGEATQVLRMPWYYWERTRRDANLVLSARGLVHNEFLRMNWDEATHSWAPASSGWENRFWQQGLGTNVTDLKEYKAQASEEVPTFRTGYIMKRGQASGFMQVNSFLNDTVARNDQNVSFTAVVTEFVNTLKAQGLPLILDIRNNGGGNPELAVAIMSAITEAGKTYGPPTTAFRVSRHSQQMIEYYSMEGTNLPGPVTREVTGAQVSELFEAALAGQQQETAAFSDPRIAPNEIIQGYSGKVVAMISPACISACDIMAFLLKSSQRATLIGTPANGTGAGFQGFNGRPPAWTDPYGVFSARIPNFLFGEPISDPNTTVQEGGGFSLNTENRPTQPDLAYAQTAADLQGSTGWINAAFAQLYPVAPVEGSTHASPRPGTIP